MDTKTLRGTVQNDVLKEYIARGTYIYPPQASMRIVTDLFAWAGREMPKWNVISISGYHMREAGATAAQEVAFTLANAFCVYRGRSLRRARDRRLRAAAFVLLQRRPRFPGGDREVPSGSPALRAPDERAVSGEERQVTQDALPCANGRLFADSAAALRQRYGAPPTRRSRLCSAGRSRSTRTVLMRLSPCPPNRPPSWRCGPSR